jgi:nitrogen fixation protein FixH
VSAAGITRAAGGRSIPWLFVAFFGVVLSVNLTMIWFAVGSFPGLATERAYDRGLAYNRNLDAAAAQDRLGWHGDLEARTGPDHAPELVFRLRDRSGAPLSGASVSARLERPVETTDDLTVALDERGPGIYLGRPALPHAGVWDVHLVVSRGTDLYVLDRRVTVR